MDGKIVIHMKTWNPLSVKDIQDIEDSLKKLTKFKFQFLELKLAL